VAALRSGEYTQARGCLRLWPTLPKDRQRFCVAGVACDVAAAHGWGEWQRDRFTAPDGLVTSTLMPEGIRVALGLSPAALDSLVTANDDGVPLSTLAAALED